MTLYDSEVRWTLYGTVQCHDIVSLLCVYNVMTGIVQCHESDIMDIIVSLQLYVYPAAILIAGLATCM